MATKSSGYTVSVERVQRSEGPAETRVLVRDSSGQIVHGYRPRADESPAEAKAKVESETYRYHKR